MKVTSFRPFSRRRYDLPALGTCEHTRNQGLDSITKKSSCTVRDGSENSTEMEDRLLHSLNGSRSEQYGKM